MSPSANADDEMNAMAAPVKQTDLMLRLQT
jgi:hypothetical protein